MRHKVAIVGCGRMGIATTERTLALLPTHWFPLSHAAAVRAHGNLEVVAVCDVSDQKAKEAGTSIGLPAEACFTNVEEMLRRHKPDILSIATRTPGRTDIIRSALNAGVRAIHSEKPLSQELPVGEALMNEIERAGVHFTYGTLRRFMAPYRVAKNIVDSGQIGAVHEIAIDHGHRELLMWSHPHSADLLIYFGGIDIESVNAVCDFGESVANNRMIDCDPRVDFARARFSSGIQGLITGAGGMTTRITGADGVVSVIGNGERVEICEREGGPLFTKKRVVEVPAAPSGTAQAFIELHDALMGRGEPSISPAEIAAGQRLLWAIATSSLRQGQMVQWRDVNDSLVISGRFGDLTA